MSDGLEEDSPYQTDIPPSERDGKREDGRPIEPHTFHIGQRVRVRLGECPARGRPGSCAQRLGYWYHLPNEDGLVGVVQAIDESAAADVAPHHKYGVFFGFPLIRAGSCPKLRAGDVAQCRCLGNYYAAMELEPVSDADVAKMLLSRVSR